MNEFLLAADLGDFLTEWYGVLLFVLIDILIVLVIVAVTYRLVFKNILDFLCGLVATLVTSPVWLVVIALSRAHMIKTNEYKSVFSTRIVAGKNGKKVALHSFTVRDDLNGEYTALGAVLHRTGIEKLPAVFDLLTLRTSLVGGWALSPVDEKFVTEEDYARFSVRPGYFHPSVLPADKDAGVTYEDLFRAEREYAARFGFFSDVAILVTALVRGIRGEKYEIVGETAEMSYAEALLSRGEISREDYAAALAEEGIAPPAQEEPAATEKETPPAAGPKDLPDGTEEPPADE